MSVGGGEEKAEKTEEEKKVAVILVLDLRNYFSGIIFGPLRVAPSSKNVQRVKQKGRRGRRVAEKDTGKEIEREGKEKKRRKCEKRWATGEGVRPHIRGVMNSLQRPSAIAYPCHCEVPS